MRFVLICCLLTIAGDWLAAQETPPKKKVVVSTLREVQVPSSLDGELQSVRYFAPEVSGTAKMPVLIFLHSWSGDFKQDNSAWQYEAERRGWLYLHPDFRGPNQTPKACGSAFARQDVLDSLDWAASRFAVDSERVYLAGTSGGGHMAMLMAGHHPDRFSAVSAWVGISDLAEWHRFHARSGTPGRYAQMIASSLGGPPGESPELDRDYRDRSPVFHLQHAIQVPLDLWAGVNDGHTGSVPVAHTLRAFNVVAAAASRPAVSEAEIKELSEQRRLTKPQPEDLRPDPESPRGIVLRRTAGLARVTIFDGGHEGLPEPAVEWLARQRRRVKIATE